MIIKNWRALNTAQNWLRFTISGTGQWWVSPLLDPFVDDIPWKVTQCMNSGFKVMELVSVRPAAKELRQAVRGDASAHSGLCQLQITKALVHFGDVWFDSRLLSHTYRAFLIRLVYPGLT